MGDPAAAFRAGGGLRCGVLESAADGVRRDNHEPPAAPARAHSGVRAHGDCPDAGTVDTARAGRLVPAGGKVDRLRRREMDRHSRASGNPATLVERDWVPVFAGTTAERIGTASRMA